MEYNIVWNIKALDSLKKIDKPVRKKIFKRITDYLAKDPVNLGKPLRNDMSGFWRYRYGDYRIIYTIDFDQKSVKILVVGHRRNIYSDTDP